MKLSVWAVVLFVLLSHRTTVAQDAQHLDPCHAMPAAGTVAARNFLAFNRFDQELRTALIRKDAIALSFLVTFPLRVNDAGGTFSLDDPAALRSHFEEVFTPAVRSEILNEKADHAACSIEGIGYGRGVIWVNASERGYAIWSVNRDAVPPYPKDQQRVPRINYVCQTQTHRIVVDTAADGVLRYRSWNKPRSVTENPDLDISKGSSRFEGTDLCAIPIYTFKNGSATYMIDGGLGCFGDSEPGRPPKDATGRLEVTVAGKSTDSWCY